MNSYTLLALDPGKTTGWAEFKDDQVVKFGTANFQETFDLLSKCSPNYFVVEDYVIRTAKFGGHSHDFNKGEALQVIGAAKFRAYQIGATINLQPPSLKPGAYAQMGAEYKKGARDRHHMDAIAHGTWYINNKLGGFKRNG